MQNLFITNIPSPYQVDLFSAMQAARPDSFHVIFCAAGESDRMFEVPKALPFSCQILPSPRRRWVKDWHANRSLLERMGRFEPRLTVIGGSYWMPDARTARRHAMERGTPWVYWGEDPFKRSARGMRAALRRAYLRQFLRSAAGAIGIGSRARVAYSSLMPGRPAVNIPYSPDLSGLLTPDPASAAAAAQLRRGMLGDSEGVVILFCGSLVERKAPDLLLRTFAQPDDSASNTHLVFAGDGPLRGALQEAARRGGVADRVHFPGFIQGEALNSAYLASDVFVLPSRGHEGWGVVIQEAMAAGLAVVASDHIGAAVDLIENGKTGLTFPADDLAALKSHLRSLVANAAERTKLGAAARRRVVSTGSVAAVTKMLEFADELVMEAVRE